MAIDAVTNAASLLTNVLGSALPWKTLRHSAAQLNRHASQMTRQNADLLGQIKTSFLNVFDEYDSTERTVYEWCNNAQSILTRYIQLANHPNTSAQRLRVRFLVNVLNKSINDFEKARNQLKDLLSMLNVLSVQLNRLEANLQRDYNEQSRYFQQLINSQSNSRRPNRQAVANLKSQLNQILAFYQGLGASVQRVISIVAQANSQLPTQIHGIAEQKPNIESSSINALAQLSADHGGVIRSAEKLVSLCQEYHREHK